MAQLYCALVPDFQRDMPQNLTGVPSIWGDLNLAGQTMNALSDKEQMARKKKIMAAGLTGDFQTATQFLFPGRLNQAGTPMTGG